MAKQLYPECEAVIITSIQILQIHRDNFGTYVVINGESVDGEGNSLIGQEISTLIHVDDLIWNYNNVDKVIRDVASLVKDELKVIIKDKTNIDV